MRLGVIDLGTNSVRFSVYLVDRRSRPKRLVRHKRTVSLGRQVFSDGRLGARAAKHVLSAFVEFRRIAFQLKCTDIRAVATAALREASDGALLVDEIQRATGIHLKIIPGAEEARLISQGILADGRWPKGGLALLDIGGGSAELSICQNKQVCFSLSLPFGGARIAENLRKRGLPGKTRRERLKILQLFRIDIRRQLFSLINFSELPLVHEMVCSGGSARRIVRSAAGRRRAVSSASIAGTVGRLCSKSVRQIRQEFALDESRAEGVAGTAILLEELISALGIERIRSTKRSLSDGVAEEARASAVIEAKPENRASALPKAA